MTLSRVLTELESLAARLGIAVRPEAPDRGILKGRGGLCWVRGQPVVVMDASLAVIDRIGVLADALARFDLDAMVVRPAVMARIEAARGAAGGRSESDVGPASRALPAQHKTPEAVGPPARYSPARRCRLLRTPS